MRCTDNKTKRRRISKRQKRRRALIRSMTRILMILCFVLLCCIYYKYSNKEQYFAKKYEVENYNTSYHKENLFASELCVVNSSEDKTLSNLSQVKAYGLFDVDNQNASYASRIHEKIYPASTTKILTALVALENADLSDEVSVSKNACSTSFAWDEQTCGIKEGDTLTMESLLYGLLLYSGNDTAVAIAEHVGGSVEAFAEMMNQKANELMATNSHFTNPSGLYDDEHYTTAYDLYLIFNECIKHEEFVTMINADKYTTEIKGADSTIRTTLTWEPTNYYALGEAEGPEHVEIIGGKTGTLIAAGNCLILLVEDNKDHPYISIVMGADSKDLLYQDMTSVLSQIPKNN